MTSRSARALLAAPLLLLALTASAAAKPLFWAPISCDTGTDPWSVAIGDLNRDGRPDVAIANNSSQTISVMLGNGDCTFRPRTDLGVGSQPVSVAIGDLNRDGRPDLAVANYRSNTISVLLGNGDGTFRPRTDFVSGVGPYSVAIADLNADGRPDLATANAGSRSVSVLLGNGDGTFGANSDFGTGIGPRSLAVSDLNADGQLDLVVANFSSRTVSVLLGFGDGSLGPKMDFETGAAPTSVAIGDFNADHRPDLAVVNSGLDVQPAPYNGSVSVMLGNGNGTFQARAESFVDMSPRAVAIADFNADGRLDLAVTNSALTRPDYPSTVSLLLGNGNGTFQYRINSGTGNGPVAVAAGDINGDGRSDLAVANLTSNTVSVLPGNGNGTFGATTHFSTTTGDWNYPYSVAVGDLNGDGRPDLAASKHGTNSVSVMLGRGDGTFGPNTIFETVTHAWSVAIADLNADGRQDLALAIKNGNAVSVLLGDGQGNLGPRTVFATGITPPRALEIADFNLDGRPDITVANPGSNLVSVLLGNGNGTFGVHSDFPVGDYPWSMATGDLNRDGKPDVVSGNAVSSTVSILLGSGDGRLVRTSDVGTGDSPFGVAIGDLNADGRPDLATANYKAKTVSVMLGNGDGTFRAKTDFGAGLNPYAVEIGDLNADRHPDLVVVNFYANTVSVLLGKGNGAFATKTDYGTGKYPTSVAIADVNGDGRPDLAVSNSYSHTITVLLNRYEPPPPLAMGLELKPSTLSLASRGRWVTGYLEPTPPLAPADIEVASIRLNETVPVDSAAATAIGDHDEDGIPDLMVKFDRLAVEMTLAEGDVVPVTVTGVVDGQAFSGTDSIRVRRGRISAPHAGSRLAGGSALQLRWETPGGMPVESVALLFSSDGGGTWKAVAGGRPNTGSYEWSVPNVPTDRARLAVLAESADETGAIVKGLLGLSDVFSIEAAVSVDGDEPDRLALAIRGASPTVGGRLQVEFTLRDGSPARLELMDVAGRILASRQVGAMGPGRHSLDLATGRTVPPGIYFLRLGQGGIDVRSRVAVLR